MVSLVEIDVIVGVVVVVLIALTPLLPDWRGPKWLGTLAVFLIAVPLPGAVLLQPAFRRNAVLEQAILFVALLSFFVGALLVRLADDDNGGGGGGGGGAGPDDDPPWWPEFEESFRRYERQTRRVLA